MRLVCVLVALMLVAWRPAAAEIAADDLPPVDSLVDQLISGEVTPEQLIAMGGHMTPEYVRDVKHNLPDELKNRIAEAIHAHAGALQQKTTAPPSQPADDAYDAEYDYGDYDYTEEEPTPAADAEEPELQPEPKVEPVEEAPRGEPAVYKEEEEERPMLRAGGGMLRDDSSGGGGGAATEGGVVPVPVVGKPVTDEMATGILRKYAKMESMVCQGLSTILYKFYTMDQTAGPDKVNAEVEYQKVWRSLAKNASELDLSGLDSIDLVQKFMVIKYAGISALDDNKLRELDTARTSMETRFARTTVCDYFDINQCDLKLAQDVRVKMASSVDPNELKHYWLMWRDQLSRNMPQTYNTYVQNLHAAARKHRDDSNAWQLLMYPYKRGDSGDLLQILEKVWDQQISPLYWELHTYARYRLHQRYGALVPEDGPIPAHLFGSMEADDWSALEPIMRPVQNASSLDFHQNCVRMGYDVGTLKKSAFALYTDLGLNETLFEDYSESKLNVNGAEDVMTLARVIDRCYTPGSNTHRASVGIYPTNTTLSDFIELIEVAGEMQEYSERARPQGDGLDFMYKNRDSLRSYGLDRAVGGARALTAVSPSGLESVLDLPALDTDEELENLQMAQLLKLLPRLAASMAALRWQADVLQGHISETNYNSKWWEYKKQYQGIVPPQERDESHFDAFADGTITLTNHHLRRLIGGIAMFSVHKYQCRMYGNPSTPLSECALLYNQEIGNRISEMMISGTSKPFGDQLAAITGETELTGKALVEQMQPISEWIVNFNKQAGLDGDGKNTKTVAIIVGVVIGVIILGLIIFFVVARRKQRYRDYKGAPAQEMRPAPAQA